MNASPTLLSEQNDIITAKIAFRDSIPRSEYNFGFSTCFRGTSAIVFLREQVVKTDF